MEQIYHQLAELARQHKAQRLVLFGSRARGDNKEHSDIDLAVYGMPQKVENYQNALKRLKEAYAAGIIDNPDIWNEAVDSRNLMFHIYDEETAISIANRVCSEFMIPLTALAEFYEKMSL